MRAYCRPCFLEFNIGIGAGLSTKSYRCYGCKGELHCTPGPQWRWGGRLTTAERANTDDARTRAAREMREVRKRRLHEAAAVNQGELFGGRS